jgi:hypothetical protein
MDSFEAINLIIFFLGGIGLLLLGLIVGQVRERAHIRDLTSREEHFEQKGIVVSDLRTLPPGWEADGGRFVGGSPTFEPCRRAGKRTGDGSSAARR